MSASYASRCRRKKWLVGQRQPHLPAERQSWLDAELARLDDIPILSPEELERQRQEELVNRWEARLDEVAQGRMAAHPNLSIDQARELTMAEDKDLQLREIKKLWEVKQAEQWEKRLAKVTARDRSTVEVAVDGDPELQRGLELAEVRRRWKVAKQKPTRRRR